jgi:hypothetical protein
MSNIKNILITNVDPDLSSDEVSTILYNLGLVMVNEVKLIKHTEYNYFYHCEMEICSAYVKINSWHNTDDAENMIQQLEQFKSCSIIRDGAYDNIWKVFNNDLSEECTEETKSESGEELN